MPSRISTPKLTAELQLPPIVWVVTLWGPSKTERALALLIATVQAITAMKRDVS